MLGELACPPRRLPLWADTFISVRLLAFDPWKREKKKQNPKKPTKAWTLPPPLFWLLLNLLVRKMPRNCTPLGPILCSFCVQDPRGSGVPCGWSPAWAGFYCFLGVLGLPWDFPLHQSRSVCSWSDKVGVGTTGDRVRVAASSSHPTSLSSWISADSTSRPPPPLFSRHLCHGDSAKKLGGHGAMETGEKNMERQIQIWVGTMASLQWDVWFWQVFKCPQTIVCSSASKKKKKEVLLGFNYF